MFKKLLSKFKSILDYRVKGRTKYPLDTIIAIVFIAVLSGAHGWKGIHEFAVCNAYWLRKAIPGLTEIPSIDTLARTVSRLDQTSARRMVTSVGLEFLRRSQNRKPGRRSGSELPDVIDLDGKTSRGAIKPGMTKSDVHIVNAVCGFITLGIEMVKEKSNEITAIPVILDTLHQYNLLKGKIVTADAMGCQRKIVAKIISYGADYLIGLKGNQTGLLNDVKSIFATGLPKYPKEFSWESYATPPEKAGGRVERRVITVVRLSSERIHEWLTTAKDWVGIRSVIKVEKFNETENTSEIRYFISSLVKKPKQLAEVQKLHWQVETVHKILDDKESFAEDSRKVYRGNGAEFLSTMRKLGINVLAPIRDASTKNESQKESFGSIHQLLNRCSHYFEEVLTKRPDQIPPPEVWRKRLGDGLYAKCMPITSDSRPF